LFCFVFVFSLRFSLSVLFFPFYGYSSLSITNKTLQNSLKHEERKDIQTSDHLFLNLPAFYLKPANVKKLQSTSEYQRNSSLYNEIIYHCPIIRVYAGMDVLSRDLSLRFGNFLNKDPGHCIPACDGVSISITSTITNPESHAHLAFVNVVTVPFNIVYAVNILTP